MTARHFDRAAIGEKEAGEGLVTDGHQEPRAGERCVYCAKGKGLRRCCVWPMCVSEDKTCGGPSADDGGTHLRVMTESCQRGYQRGAAADAPGETRPSRAATGRAGEE